MTETMHTDDITSKTPAELLAGPRRPFGVELDERYCELAAQRLTQGEA